MRNPIDGEMGKVKGEEARLAWGPEGGVYRLVGMEGSEWCCDSLNRWLRAIRGMRVDEARN